MNRAVDYWELSEKERSALTREQCAKFIDFELMRKGILAIEPLTLVTVPVPKLDTGTYYRVRAGAYNRIDLAFATEAAARSVLDAMPSLVSNEYVGEAIECVSASEFAIELVELPMKSTVEAAKLTLKEAAEAKMENERRTRAHVEQGKAVESATQGLWQDWHECVAKAARMDKITQTFDKYVALAGGAEVASRFLRQVFTELELIAAEEWSGRSLRETPPLAKRDAEDVALPPEATL